MTWYSRAENPEMKKRKRTPEKAICGRSFNDKSLAKSGRAVLRRTIFILQEGQNFFHQRIAR